MPTRAVRPTFDDRIEITTWLEWIRGASLGMAYEVRRDGKTLATASTEHAMVNSDGKPVRISPERRENLAKLANTDQRPRR